MKILDIIQLSISNKLTQDNLRMGLRVKVIPSSHDNNRGVIGWIGEIDYISSNMIRQSNGSYRDGGYTQFENTCVVVKFKSNNNRRYSFSVLSLVLV